MFVVIGRVTSDGAPVYWVHAAATWGDAEDATVFTDRRRARAVIEREAMRGYRAFVEPRKEALDRAAKHRGAAINKPAPGPRDQRAAVIPAQLQAAAASLRASGFDVVDARTLLEQDEELAAFRAADRDPLPVEPFELTRSRILETLIVYFERVAGELDPKAAANVLGDLDGELEAFGIRRSSTIEGYGSLPVDDTIRIEHGEKLRRLEGLEEEVIPELAASNGRHLAVLVKIEELARTMAKSNTRPRYGDGRRLLELLGVE